MEEANELARGETLEAERSRILELIARNEIPETVLHEIALLAERMMPGAACGVVTRRQNAPFITATESMPAGRLRYLSGNAFAMLASLQQGATPGLTGLHQAVRSAESGGNPFLCVPISKQHRADVGCLAIVRLEGNVPPAPCPILDKVAAIAALALDHAGVYERLDFDDHRDLLTEVPNRILLHEGLQQVIATSRRQGIPFALIMLDLGGFQQVNDSYGSRAGDSLLRQTAGRIAGTIRRSDRLARLDGGEFAVLLGRCKSAEAAGIVAKRIWLALQRPFPVEGLELSIACGIGVGFFPHGGECAVQSARNEETVCGR